MGWIGETMDSIKSLQIRQVLTQAVSLGSLPIFQFFFCFISLIRVWNWNSMCFLLCLGDDKLWVCFKNWSFIDFIYLLGFLLRLKRTKPNCLLRLMWFCLANLNWDFQVLFSRKQKQTQNTNPEIKKSCCRWWRRWSILRLRRSLPCFPLLLLVWEKGLC